MDAADRVRPDRDPGNMASSYAYAEGITLKVFGGLNFLGNQSHDGIIRTNTAYTTGTQSFDHIDGFVGAAEFDADTGYVFGGAVGYQWDNGLILEVEAAYRRNKLDVSGIGYVFSSWISTGGSVTFSKSSTTEMSLDGDGHVSAVSLMANAWYECPSSYKMGLGSDLSNRDFGPSSLLY